MSFRVEVRSASDPLGTILGELDPRRVTGLVVRADDNGNGSIKVEVNLHTPEYALVQPGNYAVVTTDDVGGFEEGYWFGEGQDVIASKSGKGGDKVVRGGRGAIGYLVEGIIGTAGSNSAGYRTWTNPTWGQIMVDLVAQAQARGELMALSLGFDETEDSDGNPWVPLVGEFRLNVGLNLLAAVDKIRTAGVIVRCSSQLELGMWTTLGEDVSETVRFNYDTTAGYGYKGNILEVASREIHASQPITDILLQGASVDGAPYFRWFGDAAFRAQVGRRTADFAQVQASNDPAYLDAVGQAIINRSKARRDGPTTMSVKRGTGNDGDWEAGLFSPFNDYKPGDSVLVHIPDAYSHLLVRVASISLALQVGPPLPIIEFSDVAATDLPLPPEVAAQTAASGGGGSGGGGAGGGSWSGGQPCSDCTGGGPPSTEEGLDCTDADVDDFERTEGDGGFGTASGGGDWEVPDEGSGAGASVDGSQAILSMDVAGAGPSQELMMASLSEEDVAMTILFRPIDVTNGTLRFEVQFMRDFPGRQVTRVRVSTNEVRVAGHIDLSVYDNDTEESDFIETLPSVPTWEAGVQYALKIRRNGTSTSAKVWKVADAEPGGYHVSTPTGGDTIPDKLVLSVVRSFQTYVLGAAQYNLRDHQTNTDDFVGSDEQVDISIAEQDADPDPVHWKEGRGYYVWDVPAGVTSVRVTGYFYRTFAGPTHSSSWQIDRIDPDDYDAQAYDPTPIGGPISTGSSSAMYPSGPAIDEDVAFTGPGRFAIMVTNQSATAYSVVAGGTVPVYEGLPDGRGANNQLEFAMPELVFSGGTPVLYIDTVDDPGATQGMQIDEITTRVCTPPPL